MWCQHIRGLLTDLKAVLNDLEMENRIAINPAFMKIEGRKTQPLPITAEYNSRESLIL